MKIVDAVWEKRNLDVNTVEISIDKSDKLEDISKTIQLQNAEYQVIRVVDGYIECNKLLAEYGFTFVETMCVIHNNLKNLTGDLITERFKKQMMCKQMDESEHEILYNDFSNGLFKTDRIALDSQFGVELANKRYIGWIRDEIQRGAIPLNIYYKDYPAGFIIYRVEDGIANVTLGGLYSKYQNSGIGAALYSKGYEHLKQEGIKKTISAVSTNNFGAFRANLAIGYEIYRFEYIFVRHK